MKVKCLKTFKDGMLGITWPRGETRDVSVKEFNDCLLSGAELEAIDPPLNMHKLHVATCLCCKHFSETRGYDRVDDTLDLTIRCHRKNWQDDTCRVSFFHNLVGQAAFCDEFEGV